MKIDTDFQIIKEQEKKIYNIYVIFTQFFMNEFYNKIFQILKFSSLYNLHTTLNINCQMQISLKIYWRISR